tara:strand:- start:5431 stop:6510 length:1080 start_codon:yes stop_codon:yes gene_type:complete
MIPRGICIDLETTITAKISDTIRSPGFKRFETRIIEIGACNWRDTSRRFMRLVNPVTVRLTSGTALMQYLQDIHQKPVPTLNFWSKVLVNRKSVDRTMFSIEEDPAVWLVRNPKSRAEDFVRWFNGAHGPKFVSESAALRDLLAWTGDQPWLAHNGKSFDFKVLEGCAQRTGVPITDSIKFHDTLHLFRKHIPGHKSYSQPKLYEAIFSETYNAHVAIDDSLALARLCVHCNDTKNAHNSPGHGRPVKLYNIKLPSQKFNKIVDKPCSNIKVRRAMNLTFALKPGVTLKRATKKVIQIAHLKGVGPKSCQAFAKENVHSLDELLIRYKEGGRQWLKDLLPFGTHYRVVEQSILAARTPI